MDGDFRKDAPLEIIEKSKRRWGRLRKKLTELIKQYLGTLGEFGRKMLANIASAMAKTTFFVVAVVNALPHLIFT